jgi:hypothetical protein
VTAAAPAYDHDDLHDEVVVAALRELRQHRKSRRLQDWNLIDALYRAYLAAILGGVTITILSGFVGDEHLRGAALEDVRANGPAALGLVIAFAIALGLRSGARGGPLALEAADVRYVLLAPVDRDVALQEPARRQVRSTAFIGMVGGAVVGLLAYRRFPGDPVSWIASGAAVGAAAAVAMTGAGMVASGRRIGRTSASLVGVAVLAWSAADLFAGTSTSPLTYLGRLGLWPLEHDPLSLIALLPVLGLAVAGLRMVGGLSLEAAERRGRLVSHLRFAATLQDLRTVMLLRRQLGAEVPRPKPWIRLRPSTHLGRTVTWRRDWRGILRWPATRLLRLAGLGVVAGVATAGAWSGTTPLVLVAGGALFIAGLDAIEGLAQEVDHPDRQDSFPVPDGALHLRHLAAPTVVLAIVGIVGLAAAALVTGEPGIVVRAGLPLLLPAAALATGAAAVSTLRRPPDAAKLMMDSTGMGLLFHHALPPIIATIGPAASLIVRFELRNDPTTSVGAAAVSAAVNVLFVVALTFGWVRHREGLASFLTGGGLDGAGK